MNLKRWFRLPGRPSSGRKGGVIPPVLRFSLGLAAVFLIGLGIGFYAFFPADVLKGRLEKEVAARTALQISIGHLELLFPPALRGEEVTLRGRSQTPAWQIDTLTLRPLWMSLLGANPGVAFLVRDGEGTLAGTADRSGHLQITVQDLAIAASLAEGSSMVLAGTAAAGELSSDFPTRADTGTRLDLTLTGVQISGLEALGLKDGLLPLGQVAIQGDGQGERLRISRIEAKDGALAISGDGTVVLDKVLAQSRLALNLNLRPAPTAPRELADLLGAFGQTGRDGSVRLRISGSLGRPSLR